MCILILSAVLNQPVIFLKNKPLLNSLAFVKKNFYLSMVVLQCYVSFCCTSESAIESLRPLHPWGFPGKGTGVGCYFLLQGIFPDPGIEPWSPALWAGALPSKPPGKSESAIGIHTSPLFLDFLPI